jgi:hypothetical protein
MRARSRLTAWLVLVMISSWLGASRPARASELLSATSTEFQVEIDTDDACVCFPASLATEGCSDRCDPAVMSEVSDRDGLELIFQGWLKVEGDSQVFVFIMTDDGGYDPDVALDAFAAVYVGGYSDSAGLVTQGFEDPQAPYDLAQQDQLPFARFVADAQGTRHLHHVLFGTQALAHIGIIGAPGDDEVMSALAHDLIQSVRMPAKAPRWIHTADQTKSSEQAEALFMAAVGLVFVGVVVWFAVRARRRQRQRMST